MNLTDCIEEIRQDESNARRTARTSLIYAFTLTGLMTAATIFFEKNLVRDVLGLGGLYVILGQSVSYMIHNNYSKYLRQNYPAYFNSRDERN